MSDTRRCGGRTCTAQIRFVEMDAYQKGATPVRKPHPIDLAPDLERGTIVVRGSDGYRVSNAQKAELIAAGHQTFYVSHFATCPDAKHFRDRKKGQGD